MDTWDSRCAYWENKAEKLEPKTLARHRRKHPLILTGHGVQLRIRNGALEIENGRSYASEEKKFWRFYPGEMAIPERIIFIETSGAITLAVLDWLEAQDVVLLNLSYKGKVSAIVGGSKGAICAVRLQEQIAIRNDPKKRLDFCAALVRRKLEASLVTLREIFPPSEVRREAEIWAEKGLHKIANGEADSVDALRGIEGVAAARYFDVWNGLELRWKGINQHPVPTPWLSYSKRSSNIAGKNARNRKADHPINAMLNYGYAVLESQIRLDVVAHGYDPNFGIFHGNYEERPSYVLDLIEPHRPEVDKAVLEFALNERFTVKDFYIRQDGMCRLSAKLAAILSVGACLCSGQL